MTYQQFYHILQTAGKKVGLNIGTHSMRKTFGRIAYEQTGDINIVAKLLGHASPAATLAYIGITDKVLKDVRESIGLIG
jgi:integrase